MSKEMKLPKVRLRFLRTAKNTKHTLEEMDIVAECQSSVEIYSIETCAKSIKAKNGLYYVELFGYAFDGDLLDSKHGEKWDNSLRMPFTNGEFDLANCMDEFNLDMWTAVNKFGYKPNKEKDYDYEKKLKRYNHIIVLNKMGKEKRSEYYKLCYGSIADKAKSEQMYNSYK